MLVAGIRATIGGVEIIKGGMEKFKHRAKAPTQEQLQKAEAERQRIEAAKTVCGDCGTELSPDVRFCFKCGRGDIITRGELKARNQAEEQRRIQAEETELRRRNAELHAKQQGEREAALQRARVEQARELCLHLAALRHCAACGTEYHSNHRYCSECGQSTKPFSQELIFQHAQAKFPDVIATIADINRLLRWRWFR
jgi:uncharacterized OB-fold protein